MLVKVVGECRLTDDKKREVLEKMVPVLADVRRDSFSGDFQRESQFKQQVLQAFTDMETSGLLDTATNQDYCMRATGQDRLHGHQG